MKILLDENLPHRLRHKIVGIVVAQRYVRRSKLLTGASASSSVSNFKRFPHQRGTCQMIKQTRLLAPLTIVIATFAVEVSGSTVNYLGGAQLGGLPISGGFATPGVFKQGFDPHTYKYVYGDAFGNMLQSNYSQAVADGNFIPIGSGTLTMANGAFSGSAQTNVPAGERIWLFMFDHPSPDLASHFALGSGSGPNWLVGDQFVIVHHTTANEFVFGSRPLGGNWELQGFPIPEPSACALAAISLGLALFRRRNKATSTC